MPRANGRKPDQLRPIILERGFTKHAEGSVKIALGDTWVICNASVEDRVPFFLKGKGKGWVTAEYGMLARSTSVRMGRGGGQGRTGGRGQEIQRLIGRSLRAITDLGSLRERTIVLDCDVIQADGGTRTAAITGAFVALYDAAAFLMRERMLDRWPIKEFVAAISVGSVGGEILLDLDYDEDSRAAVDLNVVMTGQEQLVEIQGTAEGHPFSSSELGQMLEMARVGIRHAVRGQKEILGINSAHIFKVR
ncbi:MAG: ribonuclease PH [Candidatus Eisenbacteria sp.]|nr:ribonuclease PH [Candidatus Eisenbacteria bacterium]